MKILCIDDENRVNELISELLNFDSNEIKSLNNPKDAINLINDWQPDIIISDIKMPGLSGIELLEIIKADNPLLEVIMISGHSDVENAIASLRLGASNFIRKPIDARELLHAVKQLIEKITLRKENILYKENLECMVKEKTKQLMHAEKYAIIGRNTAHLAHNLNSSLTGILGSSQLIKIFAGNEVEKVKHFNSTTIESALKMKDIISNTLTRIRNDHIDKEMININDLIRSEINFFNSTHTFGVDVSFQLDLDPNIKSINAIASDFNQIIDNLSSNSVDAMENKKDKIIFISTIQHENNLVISFKDLGEGIKKENIDSVFNPNFTTKEIGKGTGIGLASVKELLESYNAHISIKSDVGIGTTFIIRIPN